MNKSFKIIFITFFFTVIVLGGLTYLIYKDPLFLIKTGLLSANEIGATRISFFEDSLQETSRLQLINRLPLPVIVDSIEVKVNLEGVEVGMAKRTRQLKISAFSEDTIALSVYMNAGTLKKEIEKADAEKRDSLNVKFAGNLFVNPPILKPLKSTFVKNIEAYAFRVPHIEIGKIDIKSLDLPSLDFEVTLSFRNENPVEFEIRELNYNLKFDKDRILKGEIQKVARIDSFATKDITLPLSYDLSKLGKNVVEILQFWKEHPYTLRIEGTIFAKAKRMQEIKLEAVKSGTVKFP